jgi:membrane protein YqaA with SNARE-associated domain
MPFASALAVFECSPPISVRKAWGELPVQLWGVRVTFGYLVFLATWAATLLGFFRKLGVLGLLLMGALDSSFLFLPFGNDFLLIALVSGARGPVWILYVFASAVGSLIGVVTIDLVMRKVGEEGLERFVSPKRVARLKRKLDKGVGWFVFTSTLLPPPFPFTPIIMSACALQCSRTKLYFSVFVGRLVRFTIEAMLALYFGRSILKFLNSPILNYIVYAFVAIAVVGSLLSFWKWFHNNKSTGKQGAIVQPEKADAG